MKPNTCVFVFALIALGPARVATAQDKPAKPAGTAEERIAQIQKLVISTQIETEALQEPLTKFLAILEGRLPKEKKVSIRLDKEAFGKELPKVAAAQVKLPKLKGLSLLTVLRLGLSRVAEETGELDYAVRPNGLVITRPRLASHSAVYQVRDIVDQMPLLLPELKKGADIYQDLKPTDSPALLVRLLTNAVDMQPWESIQILNGTRLAVLASPTRHEHIAELMAMLRILSDVAIVINARLYEVDRAFHTKHVAPLFARDKKAEERPTVIRIDGPLLKRITQQKLLLESEDTKIRPHQEAPFLSQHSIIHFAGGPRAGKEAPQLRDLRQELAGPQAEKEVPQITGSAMVGVAFEVRPLVSPDRRYLRLAITQNATELVGIDKTKKLDVFSGKDVEIESLNLRKTSVTGTVQIPDGDPILMPVTYRPTGKGSENKVWLLVARPFIWIEEEVKERRKDGGDLSPKSVWDSELQKEEKLVPATRLPLNNDVKQILQAIIIDVLTNPDLKSTREFYGTAKDKTFTLVDTEELGWPKDFQPETRGYALVQVQEDPFMEQHRVLGISLHKFDPKPEKGDFSKTQIDVFISNAGGIANGGGCHLYYIPKRVGKGWTVELDP